MSRIGKQPVLIPAKTKVAVTGQLVAVEGPKGKLEFTVPTPISVAVKDGKVVASTTQLDRIGKSRWGLTRSLIANMVKGVNDGYSKQLLVEGVGFRAAVQGANLNLQLGYSHPINYNIPDQIKVTVEENTKLTIEGPDKMIVGKVASEIRAFYPPEPYKGKGVRYAGEHVARKEGKTVQ